MSDVLERFLRYVRYDTRADETSETFPSTPGQLVLLGDLAAELRGLGIADASVDEHGYLMATIPARTAKANVPTIGFIAHVDTSPEMSGTDVTPIVHRAHDGRGPPTRPPRCGRRRPAVPAHPAALLRAADDPALADHLGCDIVTASGTTLLGADDKAGVAEIVSAAAHLMMHPEIAHGRVRIAFTP